MTKNKHLENAATAIKETRYIDFKREFDPSKLEQRCELVKDIVAFANSGGGVIVIGIADDGTPSEIDCSHLDNLDPADVTNWVEKYTGYQFDEFSIERVLRGGAEYHALVISETSVL